MIASELKGRAPVNELIVVEESGSWMSPHTGRPAHHDAKDPPQQQREIDEFIEALAPALP